MCGLKVPTLFVFYSVGMFSVGVICSFAGLFCMFRSSLKWEFDILARQEYQNLAKAPSDGAIRYLRHSPRALQVLAADRNFDRRSESGETVLGEGILPECANIWIRAGADRNIPWDKPDGESFWALCGRTLGLGERLVLLSGRYTKYQK